MNIIEEIYIATIGKDVNAIVLGRDVFEKLSYQVDAANAMDLFQYPDPMILGYRILKSGRFGEITIL